MKLFLARELVDGTARKGFTAKQRRQVYEANDGLCAGCDEPLADKWRSFGWLVREVDGHDHDALEAALNYRDSDRPSMVIAHTTKGRGISFMENSVLWHYRSPQAEEFEAALRELGVQ